MVYTTAVACHPPVWRYNQLWRWSLCTSHPVPGLFSLLPLLTLACHNPYSWGVDTVQIRMDMKNKSSNGKSKIKSTKRKYDRKEKQQWHKLFNITLKLIKRKLNTKITHSEGLKMWSLRDEQKMYSSNSSKILYLLSAKSVLLPTNMIMTSLPLSVLTSSIHFEVCWKELRSEEQKEKC